MFVIQVVNKNMDIKKIKDMIWNFIFMSSEFGDDICCYFKVIFGKIKKKKLGKVKRKQKIVFIYL